MGKRKYHKQKINTYVTTQTLNRLRLICKQYEFNSIYQLLQYLIQCFLRVADPQNDPIIESIPEEIEDMFTSNSEWEKRKDGNYITGSMNIKKTPDQRKITSVNDL